jgi:glyoxylase-like metal-dependent hydrolase (beta-lactamase superfamily II)
VLIAEITHPNLDPRVRVFRACDVDCIAIISSSHVIILDTFSTPEEALEMMQLLTPSLEHRQLLVINSHQHYDHAWGNAIFESGAAFAAPILAHELSKEYLEQQKTILLEKQAKDTRFANVKIVAPTIYFSQSLTIYAGDLTLWLQPAFGHTQDQIAIWIPEILTLLATDALEFPFPYVSDSGSLKALLMTMQHFKTLQPKVIVPCHGGVHNADLINLNLEYFSHLETRVRDSQILEADLDAPDLPERIGFTFLEALSICQLETADQMYKQFHVQNIKCTWQQLQNQT